MTILLNVRFHNLHMPGITENTILKLNKEVTKKIATSTIEFAQNHTINLFATTMT